VHHETNRIHLALFGVPNRTFGPCLAGASSPPGPPWTQAAACPGSRREAAKRRAAAGPPPCVMTAPARASRATQHATRGALPHRAPDRAPATKWPWTDTPSDGHVRARMLAKCGMPPTHRRWTATKQINSWQCTQVGWNGCGTPPPTEIGCTEEGLGWRSRRTMP
jgi:hypothetical protein